MEISAAEGDVIEIGTPEELAKIGKDSEFPMTGDYVLTEDLDMTELILPRSEGHMVQRELFREVMFFRGLLTGRGI